MSLTQTLRDRYHLPPIEGLTIAAKDDESMDDHTLIAHCADTESVDRLFAEVLADGLTVRLDVLARDFDCPNVEVWIQGKTWLSYHLDDLEMIRKIFLD